MALLPDELLQYVMAVLRSYPEHFGYLRVAGGGPLDPGEVEPEPDRVPLLLTRSTHDSLVVSTAASRCRGASKALGVVLACWAGGLVLGLALGLGVLSSGSSARASVRFGRVAAVLGIPAVLLGSLAQQLDTLRGSHALSACRFGDCWHAPYGMRICQLLAERPAVPNPTWHVRVPRPRLNSSHCLFISTPFLSPHKAIPVSLFSMPRYIR